MKIVGCMLPKEEKAPFLESDAQGLRPIEAHSKSPLEPTLDRQPEPRKKLTRAMRMNTFEVANVLKFGKRSRIKAVVQARFSNETNAKLTALKPVVEARTLSRNNAVTRAAPVKPRVASYQIGVRLAAAVPKRLLKRSVDRNLVKRWIRESVRQHVCRFNHTDLLLTLTAKFNPKSPEDRAWVKQELSLLITDALSLSRTPSKPRTPWSNS